MAKRVPTPWFKSYGKRKKTIKYPDTSMYDEVRRIAKKYPDYMALNYFGNKTSFGLLLANIDRAAQGFISLGAKKGDVISVCAPNIPEAIVAIYAINKIGAVANIFHPLSAPNEIRDNLNLVDSKIFVAVDIAWPNIKPILAETSVEQVVVLSPADSLPLGSWLGYKLLKVKEIRKQLQQILSRNKTTLSWDAFLARGKMVISDNDAKVTGKDIAIVLYSGGTTGASKGIALANLGFNSMAYQLNDFISGFCKMPGKTMLGIMPIFHGFGLSVGVHTALSNGVGVALFPKFDVKKFYKILEDSRPNFLIGVPALFEAMLTDKKIRKMDLSFIKAAFSGGDAVSGNLRQEVNKLFKTQGSKARLLEGYGLTESVTVCCVNPINHEKDGSIGIPVADTLFKIVEPKTYISKPSGQEGEIVVSGPLIMDGYVNNEKETNAVLQLHPDGHVWLHTGDMGYMDRDGYVFFTGRIKRMIISNGYNIYPNELESVINQIPEVLLSTVIGIPDRSRGQIAKAFVVLKNGHKPSADIESKIMKACAENLTKYKWPRKIEFRKSMPKTKIGKIAYAELEKENH